MKRIKYIATAGIGAALAIGCLGLFVTGCKKKETTQTNNGNNNGTPANNLLTYKNSQHPIFVGFLVGDGNDPVAGYNPANVPDSVDYVEFFAGRDTVQADWRAAQAKGTKIVACHFISDAYFDGSAKDPATKVPGYVNPPGFDQLHPTSTSTYYHWAKDMYNKEIVGEKLDGIDLDIESGTFGGDVLRTAANGDSLMVAVAKYYGPKCTECTVMNSAGKKPVFFYDTDGSGGFESTMFGHHKDNYDYVLFQSYTTGSHYWNGKDTTSFTSLISTYGKEKLVFLVNGDSFIYPDGKEDQAGGDAKATADLVNFATYAKNNHCGGAGVYRMSRDYNHKPPFAASKNAIQIMNPAK